MHRSWQAILIALSLALAALPAGAAGAGARPDAVEEANGVAWVRLRGARLLPLHAAASGGDATARARDASAALAIAVAQEGEVAVDLRDGEATLRIGSAPILVLGPADAAASAAPSVEILARDAASRLGDAVRGERRRLAVQGIVFSISLLVASALLVFLVARRLERGAAALVVRLRQHRFVADGVRVAGTEVASAGVAGGAAAVATQLGLRLGQAALVYGWVLFALSLFPGTRGAVARLTGAVFDPAIGLALRLVRSVPMGVAVLLAAGALALVLRSARLVMESVARGESHVRHVPRDLARPAVAVLETAAVIGALALAPLFLGETGGPVAWLSMAALLATGAGAVPLLANAAAGVPLVLGRVVRVGDRIEAGGQAGRVASLALLALELEDDAGARVRVPWLALSHGPVRVLGAGAHESVDVGVDPAADPAEVEALLRAATGPGAQVALVSIDGAVARWRVVGRAGGVGVRAAAALRGAGIALAAPGDRGRTDP
ncbi:MAG TPA: mechanosensitive ion channel domain-containing protein [Anaeromyxobacteraceae bacterium]|nr:mechanosensitive ion channel domain-containing protein [Anaeromyxobacteraceae bacterium]